MSGHCHCVHPLCASTLACRNLTSLRIRSNCNMMPPQLPTNLQNLDVSGCSNLHALPALPATLLQLDCRGCASLKTLPSSLSGTAVVRLSCSGCSELRSIPELPSSLVELDLSWCSSLRRLPALPQSLTHLYVAESKALKKVRLTACLSATLQYSVRQAAVYHTAQGGREKVCPTADHGH
jgi:hypothetical protein